MVLICGYLASGAQRGGKHALQYTEKTAVCEEKTFPIFWIVAFERERRQTKETERLVVEAPKKYPCPTARAS